MSRNDSKNVPTLANHNAFSDPAFLRDFAEARAHSAAISTPSSVQSRPEPASEPTSGRKTFDTRKLYRPELPYGHANRYGGD